MVNSVVLFKRGNRKDLGEFLSIMICLCGCPGSGKTTWAKKFIASHPDFIYFSPDEYYEIINGDERIRDNKELVWEVMCKDIKQAELSGRNVLIDSDNSTVENRQYWIDRFPFFEKKLYYLIQPFDVCLDRVRHRRRTIPEDFLKKRYSQFVKPSKETDPNWEIVEIH